MRRREIFGLIGGAAVLPLVANAQQAERMRRIGVLTSGAAADDPDGQARSAAFVQGLQQLGWTDGRNMRIDYRWGAGDADDIGNTRRNWSHSRRTSSGNWRCVLAPLLQATRTVPIVFVQVTDPVGAGFVDSLARPGGNATGLLRSNMASAENVWSCSKRSRRV